MLIEVFLHAIVVTAISSTKWLYHNKNTFRPLESPTNLYFLDYIRGP